jgi:intracellular septation protein
MKFLFDLFPVALFFVSYTAAQQRPDASATIVSAVLGGLGAGEAVAPALAPILIATMVAIVATFSQVGWLLIRRRKVDTMLWISLAVIVVMGGATLALRDPTFIKWKPTVLYWAFAGTLLGADLLLKRNLVAAMLKEQVYLPQPVWTRLNLSWVGFFLFMGAANLYVAYNFSETTWVKFKLFGGIGLMLVFVVLQALFLARHVQDNQESR